MVTAQAALQRLYRDMPRGWPAAVKHVVAVLYALAATSDGGTIVVSVRTLCEVAGEPRRSVYRVLAFLRVLDVLVEEAPDAGSRIPIRHLRLARMAALRRHAEAADAAAQQAAPPAGLRAAEPVRRDTRRAAVVGGLVGFAGGLGPAFAAVEDDDTLS